MGRSGLVCPWSVRGASTARRSAVCAAAAAAPAPAAATIRHDTSSAELQCIHNVQVFICSIEGHAIQSPAAAFRGDKFEFLFIAMACFCFGGSAPKYDEAPARSVRISEVRLHVD